MAATAIAEQSVKGPYASGSPALTTVTFTNADAVNGNVVVMSSGRTLILVQNTAGEAGTVTIESSKDPFGRESDISAFSVSAGAFAARIFTPVGWEQTLGARDIAINGSATTMKILAIPL